MKNTVKIDVILLVFIILITLINPYFAYSIGFLGGAINSKIHVFLIPVTFFLTILCIILILIFFARAIKLFEFKNIYIFVIRILLIIFSFWFSIIFFWTHGEPYSISFTKGLAYWAENNIDVTAMEEYLNNVNIDEDNIRGDSYKINKSDWPAAIRELKPESIIITNIYDNDRKQIHFMWGGGFFGWGMVVGVNVSENQVFNLDKNGEYKILFHPNGYVFGER